MQLLWLLALLCARHGTGDVTDVTDHLKSPIWYVQFEFEQLNMTMQQSRNVSFTITDIESSWGPDFELHVLNENDEVIYIDHVNMISSLVEGKTLLKGNFTANAIFLGYTSVHMELQKNSHEPQISQQLMKIIVTRPMNLIDIIFNVCIASFVIIIYVNFGAVLDLADLKAIVIRPVGPAIGLFCQFGVMPVLSFLIGYFLFREMIELRLGLFFLGVSPAGGASNMFAVLLDGNLSLSITMTTISNLAAFVMMPLWIFTLGALIFRDGNFAIPYNTIAVISFTLVVPIAVGLMLQKYAPEVTSRISKLLKPISLLLILSIIIFGCIINSFIFKLLSIEILIGSCVLPWLGYIIGWLLATLLGQPAKDAITISIETGILNVGIPMFMLNFTLPQPQADMTSVVPIANALLTPLPLLLIYFLKLCFWRKNGKSVEENSISKEVKESEGMSIMEKGAEKENDKYAQ
ncbi:sodium/bile acid cotransporter-like [Rhagoletis pomonella]|uniref:sodium/bile acid cotransporter-like n=1 Tax=Rhagoletis pomonella TaxID=28610 RepID=UPI00178234E8|nr:sodium/bile acid cotransporter-like [Rhagoletis pomonella]